MGVKTTHAADFKLPSIACHGFAMGHRSGSVSLSFSLGISSFAIDALPAADMREIARAITEAADFADAERAKQATAVAAEVVNG